MLNIVYNDAKTLLLTNLKTFSCWCNLDQSIIKIVNTIFEIVNIFVAYRSRQSTQNRNILICT